jgi:hypothetical protein
MISAMYHSTSHYISFSRRQKLGEEKVEKQILGIHQSICPFCQCGREALVTNDDNSSVNRSQSDEGDDKDADSEMGSLEN